MQLKTIGAIVHQKTKYGALYKILILIVIAVVIMAGAAGYYSSLKEDESTKQSFDLFNKMAPLRVPQTQIDKDNQILKPTVQDQKTAVNRRTEPSKKDASQPMVDPALLTASPAQTKGSSSSAIKENKPANSAPPIEEKSAQPPAEEKKVIAPPFQEAAVNATMYCVNVALCKLKESADVVIQDLQRKGYEPADDTITVNDNKWYRVTLGHFQTWSEAQNYANELHSKENIKGFVVKKEQ